MSSLGKKNWEVIKGIMRNQSGTQKVCFCFGNKYAFVEGYIDVDYVGDLEKRRFALGYVFMFIGGAESWRS